MLNSSLALSQFFTDNYDVKRASDGAYVDGIWSDDDVSADFVIEASIQIGSGEIFDNQNNAVRFSEILNIYTTTQLRGSKDSKRADVIDYQGHDWKVIEVDDWSQHNHYAARAVRLKDAGSF